MKVEYKESTHRMSRAQRAALLLYYNFDIFITQCVKIKNIFINLHKKSYSENIVTIYIKFLYAYMPKIGITFYCPRIHT